MVFTSPGAYPPPNNPRCPNPEESATANISVAVLICPVSTLVASNSNHDTPFQYSRCAESVLKRMEPGGQSDGLSAVVPFGGTKYC